MKKRLQCLQKRIPRPKLPEPAVLEIPIPPEYSHFKRSIKHDLILHAQASIPEIASRLSRPNEYITLVSEQYEAVLHQLVKLLVDTTLQGWPNRILLKDIKVSQQLSQASLSRILAMDLPLDFEAFKQRVIVHRNQIYFLDPELTSLNPRQPLNGQLVVSDEKLHQLHEGSLRNHTHITYDYGAKTLYMDHPIMGLSDFKRLLVNQLHPGIISVP